MSAIPGTTPHGQPMERVDMGETEIPQEVFMEFMDNMRETYTADAYHLLGESIILFAFSNYRHQIFARMIIISV